MSPCADIKTTAEPLLPPTPEAPRPAATNIVQPLPPKPSAEVQAAIALKPRRAAMYYDMPGDGALWVRGQDYKMSFSDAGAIYYPRFGARQLHNVPLVLSPDRVSSSGAALAFDGAVAATRTGDRVEIDRGAFVEAYDFTPESIEQTFVFHSLPNRGDLVLHIPIASELEGRAASAGLEFQGEFGRVSYSRAVAIDASGRKVEADTELVEGSIELRVGAEFLDTAILPLVIDPVVSTFVIDGGFNDAYAADVAWHDNYFCWFVVYEETYSSTDHDIYARIMNVDGTVRHQGYVDFTTTDWRDPNCAAVYGADQFLVAAAAYVDDVPSVRGREVGALDLAMYPQITISRPEDGPAYNPDVGGDPYPGLPSSYAVVYERVVGPGNTDILVRQVNVDNTLIGTLPIYLSNSTGTVDRRPSISKSNDADEWMITWHRDLDTGGDNDVYGARLQYNGITTQPPFQITSSSVSERETSVSSPMTGTNRYLVAFTANVAGDQDVRLVLVDGATTVDTFDLSFEEGLPAGLDQRDATVDCDGSHFVIAYSGESPGTNFDIYVSEVGLSDGDLTLLQSHQNLAASTTLEWKPAIASYRASGGTQPSMARRYVVAWDDLAATRDVEGAMFDGQDGGPMTPVCFGDGSGTPCPCGNNGAFGRGCANSVNASGALLQAVGSASVATDSVVLQASGMPNGSCLYFQGTGLNGAGNGFVFGDGLQCVGGTVIRLGAKTNVGGSSQYPSAGDPSIHVVGQVPAAGALRYYQAWYRNAAAFCTPAVFNLTNAMRTVWTP